MQQQQLTLRGMCRSVIHQPSVGGSFFLPAFSGKTGGEERLFLAPQPQTRLSDYTH